MSAYESGQILGGKYRLIRQLGRGGMGSVWLAHHATLNAPVALKVIDSARLGEDALQRFLGEARMAAALRSPHVVQILDYGVDGGTPHIAMEVLEGETLAQRLQRVQRLSVAETARVVQQVSRAIARAHDAGVVHRDLKPENIFIVQNDDDELIKVLDFGIAKASPGMLGTSVAPETRTGAILGTPYYMSPEQVDGDSSVDFRADIWALGVVAYQCLLGQLPFQGDSVGRLVLAICTRPLPVPSSVGSVPAGFDAWFARACAREAAQRFGSVRQAASELLALSDAAPVSSLGAGATVAADARTEVLPAAAPSGGAAPGVSGGETHATGLEALRTTTGQASNTELEARAGSARWRRGKLALTALALAAAAVLGWRLLRPAAPDSVQATAVVAPPSPAPVRELRAPAAPAPPATEAPPSAVEPPLPAPSEPRVRLHAPAAGPEQPPSSKPPRTPAAAEPTAPRPAPPTGSVPAARRKPSAPVERRPSTPGTRVPDTPPADLDLGI